MRTFISILIILIARPCIAKAQDTLCVNEKATLHLQCSGNIIYCDLGSDMIKASIAPNVPSLLRIKATSPFEQITSISVMTDEKNFSTYVVKYTSKLDNYLVRQKPIPQSSASKDEQISPNNDKEDCSLIESINSRKAMLNHIFVSILKVQFNINSIYTAEDKVYITVSINNKSAISYKADATFVVADIGRNRSAAQDIVMIPNEKFGKLEAVAGGSATATYAFDKLALSENKKLLVNLYEIDGYRNAILCIDSKDIANAKAFIQ